MAVYHPGGQEVLLQGGELPSLALQEGQDIAQAVRDTWGLAVWMLHDGGYQFGLKDVSLVRMQAI